VSKQTSTNDAQIVLLTFNPLPDFFGSLFSLGQVRLDFVRVTEVEGNHGIDIGQGEGGVALDNRFRGRTVLESMNNQLQENPRVADAQSAGSIFTEGRCF